ncbi:hypothetical protein F503_08118 [Ophiostoma piceae UAMH 11346]|uniref:Uncharacterized protein n=1 Tax=Ophiostoma piceae (strain UAMH 11346) TaxID=1262450 RepID=S3C3U9_OPHP1|nr:hypothetical protein F503_08118 [Ophiostoma piceae UAMH 11346]
MPTQLRQRAPPPTAATGSASMAIVLTSRPSRSSNGRDTRHAAIATYAEPPSDDEALEEEVTEDDQDSQVDLDSGESEDVDDIASDESGEEDDENDLDFGAGRRASKRPLADDVRSLRSGPLKRRRLPRRRASTAAAPAPVPSTPSPRASRQSGRIHERTDTTPRKRNSLTSFISDDRTHHAAKPARTQRPHTPKSKSSGKQPLSPHDAKQLPPSKKLPWESLPYMVLVDIFEYASHPLDSVDSVRWLTAASRTCRSFIVPALRVLYNKPPLLSMNMAHSLFDMLTRKRMKPMFPYHSKIRALSIDVALASLSYKGRRLDIAALVSQCPRLAHVDLRHSSDGPPYRDFAENLRFAYPDELFEALGAGPPLGKNVPTTATGSSDKAIDNGEGVAGSAGDDGPKPLADASKETLGLSQDLIIDQPRVVTKLESWRWNFRMFGTGWKSEVIRDLHQTPTFSGLRKVTFVNFPRMSMFLPNTPENALMSSRLDQHNAGLVAGSLKELPYLKHLAMESCSVLDEHMLEMLPTTLEHLELISCNSVAATPFASYLVTHGQNLRCLTLNHNRSLSLEFLTVLGTACPNLEELRMNLTYYSPLQFSGDSNPDYDHLFTEEQVPAWPKTIRVLQLENLRKWDAPAAEMFFQSLVDSAPQIPHLRVLLIKAMLNIPWRQRSQIRDKWESTLNRVFKRRWTPPEPAYSLSYYDKYAKARKRSQAQDKVGSTAEKPAAEPSRRSTRVPAAATTATAADPSLASSLNRSATSKRFSYREPDTDDEERDSEDDSEDEAMYKTASRRARGDAGKEEERLPVHGMCDLVNVKFDNQKPVEVQYTMEDFEDSEPDTGDEDWTG